MAKGIKRAMKVALKVWVVLSLAVDLKPITLALAAYAVIALLLQVIINKGLLKGLGRVLLKIKIAKRRKGGMIVIWNPISVCKKLGLWIISDHIIPPALKRKAAELSARADAAFEVEEAGEEVASSTDEEA